jgi:AcrR family transcriptional regulator
MKKDQTTRDSILEAALALAEEKGFQSFTRDEVAERVGCAMGSINYHYETMKQLRRAVMGEAIKRENLIVVAQGMVANDPRAKRAPEELRRKAVEHMMAG